MLLAFRVKNFLSFREEAILDLRPDEKFTERSTYILIGRYKALKTVPIYGANSSGKSNLILAIDYMCESILFSIFGAPYSNMLARILPFLLDGNEEPTELEILFEYEERLYLYGFTVQHEAILSEWLDVDNVSVFSRNSSRITSSNQDLVFSPYDSPCLFIGELLRTLSRDVRTSLVGNIEVFFQKHFYCLSGSGIGKFGTITPGELSFGHNIGDTQTLDLVTAFVKIADPTIESIRITEELNFNEETNKPEKIKKLQFRHKYYSASGEVSESRPMPLVRESAGTLQLLLYMQPVIECVENGGVIIVDDLSAHLHPLLLEFILNYLQSETNTGAQLIYSTHSAETLVNQFRADECYFAEKDTRGRSALYSLASFKELPEDISKAYLQGRLGAVPHITPFFFEGDDNNQPPEVFSC